MKRILIWIVVLAIGYFVFGYAAVLLKWIELDTYLTLSAIIGGLASVSGLLAFTSNKIERDDIEKVGIEYFKKVVESADELKIKEKELLSKEKALSAKAKEIKELDLKKQEMEYLVRKASMSLFLKDQLERSESRIIEISEENKELKKLIEQRKTIIEQLSEIDEEIENNPNVDLITEVIEITKDRLNHKPIKKVPKTFMEYLLAIAEEITKTLVIRIK
nr:hypothetical protein [uncultured Carboxylicivirga sp.]